MITKCLKTLWNSVLVFLSILIVMIVIQSLWALIGIAVSQDPASAEQLFFERFYPITAACILVLWAKKKKEKLYSEILQAVNFRKKNIYSLFKVGGITLTILYFLFGVSGLLGQYEFIHFGVKEYSFFTIVKQTLLVGIIGNVLVAVGEEIIFRGFLLNYIINISKSKLFGLIFTSFVFSLHPYTDFLNYVIAFVAGLIMGYAYLKFKSLYIPVGIHFAYNLFNFTVASAPGRGPQLPYLVKFDYLRILDGFGAWIDLSIILGLLLIFFFLWVEKVPREKLLVG